MGWLRRIGIGPADPARPKETFWGGDLHPWRRWCAKHIDLACVGLPAMLLVYVPAVLLVPTTSVVFDNDLGASLFALACLTVADAFLLSVANTPGRALFGIRIRTAAGERPRFSVAVKRGGVLAVLGMGLMVPPLTLLMHVLAFKRLQRVRSTRWDDAAGTVVSHAPLGIVRRLACLLAVFAVFAEMVLLLAP